MTIERFAPIAVIALSLAAAAIYAFSGDIRRAVYWSAAAVLTISVTF